MRSRFWPVGLALACRGIPDAPCRRKANSNIPVNSAVQNASGRLCLIVCARWGPVCPRVPAALNRLVEMPPPGRKHVFSAGVCSGIQSGLGRPPEPHYVVARPAPAMCSPCVL